VHLDVAGGGAPRDPGDLAIGIGRSPGTHRKTGSDEDHGLAARQGPYTIDHVVKTGQRYCRLLLQGIRDAATILHDLLPADRIDEHSTAFSLDDLLCRHAVTGFQL